MDQAQVERRLHSLMDELASIEHERWAHWQRYVHSKGERRPDGTLILPAELVEHWEAQIATPFIELSAAEQESDREQVRRYLPLVAKALTGDGD